MSPRAGRSKYLRLDRYRQALSMRRAGKKWREIAEALGVSLERARQLVVRANRYEAEGWPDA